MADPYERLAEAQGLYAQAWKRQGDAARQVLGGIAANAPVSSLEIGNYGGWFAPTPASLALTGRRMLDAFAAPFSAVQQGRFDDPAILDILPFGGMTVYHGSPHKWTPEPTHPKGRFRLDKIGTGEGAQAYGWGAYFAEKKGTADFYASSLSASQAAGMRGGSRALGVRGKQENKIMQSLRGAYRGRANKFPNDAHFRDIPSFYNARADYMSGKYGDEARKGYESAMGQLEAFFPPQIYQLDIPDELIEGRLLDWDKPLSEQPEAVQRALAEKLDELVHTNTQVRVLRDTRLAEGKELSGSDIMASLRRVYGNEHASTVMRELGIPGLRYYDAGSRTAQEGTRNLVIWDQDILDAAKILED